MKKSVILGALIAATASSAQAADLYYPPAPPPAAPAIVAYYDWTGKYFGIQGGYDWNTVDRVGASTLNAHGFIIGTYFGYNWQRGNFVYGFDGALNWSFADDTFDSKTADFGFKGLLRARAGIAMDTWLLYGTAGLAVATVNFTVPGISQSVTRAGWTVGAGIEKALTSNVTARLDYAYQNYGTIGFNNPAATATWNVDSHTLTVGIAWKLGSLFY